MGLLDALNSNEGRLGVGLLAAAGPRDILQSGFGDRLQEGLGKMDAYKQTALKQKMDDMQYQMLMQSLQQATRKNDLINQALSQANQPEQPQQPQGQPQTPLFNSMSPAMTAGIENAGLPAPIPQKQTSTAAFTSGPFAGMDRKMVLNDLMFNNGEHLSTFMNQRTTPTDFQKLVTAAGIPDAQGALQTQVKKQNYTAPTRLGEGAFADANGNVQGLPTTAPPGFINVNSGGQWSTQPVSGGLPAAAQSNKAIEGAKQEAKIEMVKDASGRMVPRRMGDIVNTFGQSTVPQTGPWATMPKVQEPTGIGQTTAQEQAQKGQGEAVTKLSEKFGTSAQEANQRIAVNNQALELVDKSDIGSLAPLRADIKNVIQTFVPGISESSFQNTPSATMALQKDLVNAATQKAKQQFGSRITQSEVNLMLTRGAPNVSMPKAALKYLIESDNKASQYAIQQSQDFGKYVSGGGDPYQFEGWYANKFPMTNEISKVKMQSPQTWGIKKVN
jgi:hypothetical protein